MDVAGYSRLMGEDEQGTLHRLTEHRTFIDPIGREHGGRIVKTTGDGVLVEFPSVVEAVGFALRCQAVMATRNADIPDDEKMQFRIGINLGDVLVQDGDIFGDGVNVAARIEALAEPGGICVSRAARDQIRDRMDLDFDDMGEVEVKNIARPVRVFRVSAKPDVIASIKPTATSTTSPQRRPPWRIITAAAIVLAIVIAGGGYWWWQQPDFEPANPARFAHELPDNPSIAVLPFDNLTGDPNQDYLGEGLTENIIAVLSTSPDLFVIARNSSFTYKGKAVKVQTVAEDLGVRYVLEGSVQLAGEQLRVTAQLVDAVDGRHLWAERYDRELTDLFSILDEITNQILVAMHVNLTVGQDAAFYWKEYKGDLKTYQQIMQGLDLFNNFSPDNHRKAQELFEEAHRRQPDNSATSTWLALQKRQRVTYGLSGNPKQDLADARTLLQSALATNNKRAMTHINLAIMDMFVGKYEAAIAGANQALVLAPNNGTNLGLVAWVKAWSGQQQEAEGLYERAARADPFRPKWVDIGAALNLVMLKNYDKAKKLATTVVASTPSTIIWHRAGLEILAVIAVFQDDVEAGSRYVSQVLEIFPKASITEQERRARGIRDLEFLENYSNALRKAGLPENPPGAKPEKPAIAVLPFANFSDDKNQEYFADGMTDGLITDLSKISGLDVVARNSAFTYKGRNVKVQDVARDLDVSHVLEGSVQRDGNQIRLIAQLIDGSTGKHLWSETFDREFTAIFKLQDELSEKIVSALKVALTPQEVESIARRPTSNLEAYDALLKGKEIHRHLDTQTLWKAFSYYGEAIELDPNFAEAYAQTASLAAFVFSSSKTGVLGPVEARRRFDVSIKRALELDPVNATALNARVSMLLLAGFRDEAISVGRYNLKNNPNNPTVMTHLAEALLYAKNINESRHYIERAIVADPKDPFTLRVAGLVYIADQQYETAASYFQRLVELVPQPFYGLAGLTVTNAKIGNIDAALASLKSYLGLWSPSNLHFLSVMYRHRGSYVNDPWFETMRSVGFPEWPFGFQATDEVELSGQEIRSLLFGHTMQNQHSYGANWEITTSGAWHGSDGTVSFEGTARIAKNRLCLANNKFLMGREYCVPVYRDPKGTKEDRNEYVYPGLRRIHRFTVVN